MSGSRAKRIGVLISGRGSNLQALYRAAAHGEVYEIVCVLANRTDAAGLEWARAQGLPAIPVSHKGYARKADFEAALADELVRYDVEIVCLAGFMRLLSAEFLARWPGRVVNIHPSLLPSFPGLHPQLQAIAAGVKVSGCTVHFVSAEMDAGPIIAQALVPVLQADDEDALSGRILAAEHQLYPMALSAVCEGKIRWDGVAELAKADQDLLFDLIS